MKKIITIVFLIIYILSPLSFVTAENSSTIEIRALDVTGTEILVSTISVWKDVVGVDKTREIKVLLFGPNSDTSIAEKTIINRSDVSGIGTTIFDSSDGLKPETNYRIRVYIKETTIMTLTDTTELIHNSKGFVNVTTGKIDQKTFTSASTTDVVYVTGAVNNMENKSIYKMLVPIAGITHMNNAGCADGDNTCIPNDIGKYLNLIFKIGIALCAALAVIMLIIYGVMYMGDESIFGKTEAKSKMYSAVFGLLISLGAWALLNTINPALTGKGGIAINNVSIDVIKTFPIPASATFDGKPINVDFNTQAYPAAKKASEKTGVDTAFILAIFAQETGSGSNTGRCTISDPKANMYPEDKIALKTIIEELNLGKDINTTPVSCALLKNDGTFNGHGGAIGMTQFRPATWLENRNEAKGYLGHTPNPWEAEDALMMTAVYLKKLGGVNNQQEAACKYFGGPGISCGTSTDINNYGSTVMGKKVSIQQQIDAAIKKGDIK